MAVGDILGNSISALMAFQRAIATTSHNISNVGTEGYSLQRTELATRPAQESSVGFIGNGVEVATVRRMRNAFLEVQMRESSSTFEYFDVLHGFAGRIDSLLGDADTGLNPSINEFFVAVEGVAADPTSIAARGVLIGSAQSLVSKFNLIDKNVVQLQAQLDGELRNVVSEINSLGGAIADLNREIVFARSQASGQPPNDLLDRRDQLILDLAERVGVSTIAMQDGSISVAIGDGQPLVNGFQARTLSVNTDPFDASRLEVAFDDGVAISDTLTGGRIGGLLGTRDLVLDPALNGLGRVALGLAETFNQQHRLGLDLEGLLGQAFFTTARPAVSSHPDNTTSNAPDVMIQDVSGLTASDYLLRFDGAAWSLTDRAMGQTVAMTGTGTAADPFIADGLSISVQPIGAVAGDDYRFVIQPTRHGARQLGVGISDPTRVAAAAPLRAASAAGNLGDAGVDVVAVSDAASLPLSVNGGDITLTFDVDALGPGVPGFTVSGGPGGVLAYDPAMESAGKTFVLAPPFDGISFAVTGSPQDGDSFVITDNGNGVGDNRNAIKIGELRDALSLLDGNATIQDAYNRLVGDVGITTRQAEIGRDTQESARSLVAATRESFSGVNLDEEAANLMRFQQAYQASARVISVANDLFQELIGAVRR